MCLGLQQASLKKWQQQEDDTVLKSGEIKGSSRLCKCCCSPMAGRVQVCWLLVQACACLHWALLLAELPEVLLQRISCLLDIVQAEHWPLSLSNTAVQGYQGGPQTGVGWHCSTSPPACL